jgi:death-on-curing protein
VIDETEPEWLTVPMVADANSEQLAIFGGPEGIRDQGLLESAVSRAPNKWAYGERDFAALAAAYAFGIARNHPFVDGNKRAAFTAIFMFLGLNGYRFKPAAVDATAAILALAAGEIDEDQLARWIRDNMEAYPG